MRDPLIMCYHAVSPTWSEALAVTPKRLERQVRTLLRLGYHPATFSEALLTPQSRRVFAVTFDDAYHSVGEFALPVLGRLGVPATLFVATGHVSDGPGRPEWPEMAQWDSAGHTHELDLMSWPEITAVADAGWEIGSHTRSHAWLTEIGDAELDEELAGSRQDIEDRMGRPCTSIAYPYGAVDDRVVRAAWRAGYRAGGALPRITGRSTRVPSTPLKWDRIGVYAHDNVARFAFKVGVTVLESASNGAAHEDDLAGAEPAADRIPDAPRVAVIVPCFNDGLLAKEAVASVQEHEPVELVVVDDASTDPQTVEALDELRAAGVRVLRHEVNQGLSAARRTGLAATEARYVFPLDSDDLLVAGALAHLADRLDSDDGLFATWGDIVEFGTRDRRLSVPVAFDPYRVAYRNDYPVCSLFRRDALERVGPWQDVGGQVGYEDWNLWMSFGERGERGMHAGAGVVAVRRRLHGPRMLGDAIGRHRALYAELRRTHPRLFEEIAEHRRRSTLPRVGRLAYPWIFGGRPPLGLRNGASAALAAVRRRLPG